MWKAKSGQCLIDARKTLKEEKEKGGTDGEHDLKSAKGRKRAILCIATKMAIAVCSATQNGGFLDAFSAAGRRVDEKGLTDRGRVRGRL